MHYKDAKTILSAKGGMNLYRGCTHGCIYCDSRSECYRMEHDFEDVEVKGNAPELLRAALRKKRRKCMIGAGSMSDPYNPLEQTLCLTRRCLEIIEREGFGATLITKSDLVLRDMDLLERIHRRARCVVQMTLTTADEGLCRLLEPRVCNTQRRVEVLLECRRRGIPTVVWLSPILPYINDAPENIGAILDYCKQAGVYGVLCFGMGLTLRAGNREYYYQKLDEHFPGLKRKYQQRYGLDYALPSDREKELMALFHSRCEQAGMVHDNGAIFNFLSEWNEKGAGEQLSLF